MDAAILVLMHPQTEPRTRELATAYRVLDRLEHWLDDPRARTQAQEELEHEARSSGESGVGTRAKGRRATRR